MQNTARYKNGSRRAAIYVTNTKVMKEKKFLTALQGNSVQKVNLYVTGGGQDSAFTAGMLAAIAVEGWTDRFHQYIGQSSGSFSLMFFLGGATHEGASGYWRALPKAFNSRQLVNPWRLFNPFRSIMDLHYMVDEMFDTDPRIPWERVLAHEANRDGRLLIQVLDVHAGKNVFLSHFKTPRGITCGHQSVFLDTSCGWHEAVLS